MTLVNGTSMLPPPQRKEYAPGDVIGDKYRLLQLLGEGGMGSVWVAENLALNANVALKLIRADVAEASANERFLSEARLAARLQHAAIVRVFDFGKTENEEPFIVMELLEGETLGQRLTRLGSIDPVELCQTLLPIIDALHSAHGHGVIHRDLKPDNVFIAKAEGGGAQPKLLDFGIAKLRGESAFHTTKLTQAGTLIGSPDYMSPEQARGETDLDPRSDVWALAVLAYECLVGKPPFHGDNYNALLWSIIHDEPVPITVFQAGDSELWRLLKVGFSKNRNARWESARKFGEALAVWLENRGVTEDICNRSLHASWLPAERPTRPELHVFEPVLPPPSGRATAPALAPALFSPAPTLPALRRPHTVSLWFAGLGLLTLLGAILLSTMGEDANTAAAAPGKRDPQVEKNLLRAQREALPTAETAAATADHRAIDPRTLPIGTANTESTAERGWAEGVASGAAAGTTGAMAGVGMGRAPLPGAVEHAPAAASARGTIAREAEPTSGRTRPIALTEGALNEEANEPASTGRRAPPPAQLGEHQAAAAKAALKGQAVPATHAKAAAPPARAPRKKPPASDNKADPEFDFGI